MSGSNPEAVLTTLVMTGQWSPLFLVGKKNLEITLRCVYCGLVVYCRCLAAAKQWFDFLFIDVGQCKRKQL